MPRSIERFLLLFFFGTTTLLGVMVWRHDLVHATSLPPAAVTTVHPSVAPETAPEVSVVKAQAPSEPTAPEISGPPSPNEARGNGPGPRRGWNRLTENPEAMRLLALQQRGELDSRYADLFRLLNLSPEKRAALQDLLGERQSLRREVGAVARSKGINPRDEPEAFKALLHEAETAWSKDMQTVLSADQYAQWEAYEATTAQRALLDQLNTRLSYSGTPLSNSQQTALMSVLTANNDSDPMPGFIPGASRASASAITPEVVKKAATVLSADQQAALKALQAEQAAGKALRDLMRRESSAARP